MIKFEKARKRYVNNKVDRREDAKKIRKCAIIRVGAHRTDKTRRTTSSPDKNVQNQDNTMVRIKST